MPYLDVAFAFSLTMLVVSTAVTGIVRLIRTTARFRNEELQKMLREYFDHEILPTVQWKVQSMVEEGSEAAAKQICRSADKLGHADVFKENELKSLISVSTEELVDRLKRSDLGVELATKIGVKSQEVMDELGRRYEAVGDKFTESFRNHTRAWSTVVALILAVVFNIDSLFILDTYMKNDKLREEILSRSEVVTKAYDERVKSRQAEDPNTPLTGEEMRRIYEETEAEFADLTDAQYPLGWSYFPYAGFLDDQSVDFKRRSNWSGIILWIAGIALTALLAGRGAPFWYAAFMGLSRVVQRRPASGKPAQAVS